MTDPPIRGVRVPSHFGGGIDKVTLASLKWVARTCRGAERAACAFPAAAEYHQALALAINEAERP
jgi:hypothetical protein